MILWAWACTTLPTFEAVATEAFDVPPPPGARTIRLTGPHAHPIALGQSVGLAKNGVRLATGDVVDHTDEPSELILYVPEGPADTVLVAREGIAVQVP